MNNTTHISESQSSLYELSYDYGVITDSQGGHHKTFLHSNHKIKSLKQLITDRERDK